MERDTQKIPRPALVIDGSGSSTFVGVLGPDGEWLAQRSSGAAPLESLFATVETVLSEADLHFDSLQAYLYAAGPGSVLGLRLCAMAIETWSRLYPDSADHFAYNTLHLAAAHVRSELPSAKEARIISDWKKDLWNAVAIEAGRILEPEPITPETLAAYAGPLYHLPARKGWQSPPPEAKTIQARPDQLPRLLNTPGLIKPTRGVELYSAGSNTFQKWTARRHPPLDAA